ncbi:MAG: FAD:protein FMN transferase [Saprospiraceae bacterium]|nr:FAD:protein FMN transferase [Saprospiraceae bacterium]
MVYPCLFKLPEAVKRYFGYQVGIRSWTIASVFILSISLKAQKTRFEFQAIKMGTPFHLIIYGNDSTAVKNAAEQAWLRIDEINDIFSDYSSTSELSRIHQYARGTYYPVSKEFEDVLKTSLIYSRLSRGSFDITIGAMTRLWRRAVKMNDFPQLDKIQEAREVSGYKKLKLKNSSIKIPAGMFLDFGAIAKGYAVDEAYRILSENQFPIALIDGGGDIYCGQPPDGKQGWSITGQTRDIEGQVKDTLMYVQNASIVTSGDAFKFIEFKGSRYSHIIDPLTGLGIPGPHWTTVNADRAIHADAVATTLSVLPPGRLKKFQKKWTKKFSGQSTNWHYFIYYPK